LIFNRIVMDFLPRRWTLLAFAVVDRMTGPAARQSLVSGIFPGIFPLARATHCGIALLYQRLGMQRVRV
jgi:hypothetical protein